MYNVCACEDLSLSEETGLTSSKKQSARAKLRQYFLENVGKVLNKEELRSVAGNITEWARRIRELRNEEGYQILTHNDRADLHPGEYILMSALPVGGTSKSISQRLRAEILERDGHTCQMCGAGAGEPDSINPQRKVRLQVDHVDHTLPEPQLNYPSNLITKCRACNEGRKNFIPPPRRYIDILNILRPASVAEQRQVYHWLKRKFED